MKNFYLVVGALALCLSTQVFSSGDNTMCWGGCDGSNPNNDATTKQCGWTSVITTAPDRGIFSLDGFDSCTSPTQYDCSDPIPTNIKKPGILTCTAHGTVNTYTFSCSNMAKYPSGQGTKNGKAGDWCQGTTWGPTGETPYSCQVDNSDTPQATCNFHPKINYNP